MQNPWPGALKFGFYCDLIKQCWISNRAASSFIIRLNAHLQIGRVVKFEVRLSGTENSWPNCTRILNQYSEFLHDQACADLDRLLRPLNRARFPAHKVIIDGFSVGRLLISWLLRDSFITLFLGVRGPFYFTSGRVDLRETCDVMCPGLAVAAGDIWERLDGFWGRSGRFFFRGAKVNSESAWISTTYATGKYYIFVMNIFLWKRQYFKMVKNP